jgi:O-antigen/teichoic acid export membrane protein
MVESNFRIDSKFLSDCQWSYGAFALMATTGVILNFTIAAKLGVEGLGVFNQIYAIYVVSAHFAVLGIHESTQKHIAQHSNDKDLGNTIVLAALILASGCGIIVAGGMYLISDTIGQITNSPFVGRGVALISPGLFLFALNKVLMGVLNGKRRMKAFAVAQALRTLIILITCLITVWQELESYILGACFTIAETFLFVALFVITRPRIEYDQAWDKVFIWVCHHLSFGSRAVANGFLAESYIRVDILMLSIFVSDHAIGIYSFAALFIEGLYQIPGILRTIANPILVKLTAPGENSLALVHFCRRTMFFSIATFSVMASCTLIVFPYFAPYFPDLLVDSSYPLLIILTSGLLVYSAFIPFDYIFIQAGMPGRQSLMMALNISLNIVLNLLLIPDFGVYGAAWATATSFILSSIVLNITTWKWLHLPGGLIFASTKSINLRKPFKDHTEIQ